MRSPGNPLKATPVANVGSTDRRSRHVRTSAPELAATAEWKIGNAHSKRLYVDGETGDPERLYRMPWVAMWVARLSSAIAHPATPGESAGIPAWVRTILVRPATSVSSTVTSVMVG